MTAKERNLVKGSIRRVFSRSDLRRKVLELSLVKHEDSSRPRVKNWAKCPLCKEFIPKSYMQVDHISPLIKLTETLDDLTWDEVVDRIWCHESNLMAICETCHKAKSKAENKERRRLKKEKKS